MPMLDAFLTDLPAPEHLFPVQLAVKVDYSLNEFRMGNESHYPFIPVHHHYRRADMRVLVIQPLDLVSLQLRIERQDYRVLPRVRLHLARLRVVPRRHTSRDDVAVGDRAQVAPVLGI